MSKHHANCVKSQDQHPKKSAVQLTSKPFCDCRNCSCKECPDILKLLSITVTETSCDFGSKSKCKKDNSPNLDQEGPRPNSLLNVLNEDRACGCEVVARAVRSNIHVNLGLSEQRNSQSHKKTSIG